jgi:hypothetical protein
MSTDRDKPDKSSKSTMRSMANMIKMPSSTSNSGSTDASKKIDDVPLNEKVSKKTSVSATSKTKPYAVAQSTTVSGNKDLMLKVSHNDAGRVIISLCNPDRVLVQVQVDESVLRKGALKKAKKVPEKERPKKKAVAAKPSKAVVVKDANPKKKTSSSTKKTAEKPRDLPEEETLTKEKRSSKIKKVDLNEVDENVKLDHNSMQKGKTFARVPSSMDSVGSFSMTYSDNDSTRSPKDLHRPSREFTPKTLGKPTAIMEVNTPSMEPSLGGGDGFETISVMTPSWDRRKQNLMQFKRQSSGLSTPTIGPEDDSVDRSKVPTMQPFGNEAKMEETASHDGGMSTDSGVFSSPFQQRRLQHRQKRLDKQRSETETAFRSTRSIRSSDGTSAVDPPSQDLSVGQFMVVENKRNKHTLERRSSANRATHTRTIEPDDVDSENATSNRIRSTLAEVKKVELTNKGDPRSGRSSFKGRYPPIRDDDNEEELLASKVGSKLGAGWVKKVCDKVCNKRLRKGHEKL